MTKELQNKKIAILVTDGFEQVEMTKPRQAFDDAGATTHLISPKDKTVRGWNHYDKADEFNVDVALNQANPDDYDALLLPGGVANPDQLRTNPSVVEFIKAFFTADKPVAAICHGPWTLVEAEAVQGRKITSWPSLKTDLKNAGANWVDEEVVIDGNLVTSRNPHDIPAFISAAIALFSRVTATA
ncbi:type 1 glutamine amidotransferase domain-containing protein [Crocosphaera chwakensis]|uniref:Proteinase I n=1 Tax=Crocosphaera chwakensis CCY0110 TaxID=391612 RepID=A3INS2_9CHRO|nr:type 1 glutamine amidotransferase domain-containing protein [Crocosphaera chwakensis]EAZ91970.1 proteinase I [Crocosphaera chwakensis CCY0110]